MVPEALTQVCRPTFDPRIVQLSWNLPTNWVGRSRRDRPNARQESSSPSGQRTISRALVLLSDSEKPIFESFEKNEFGVLDHWKSELDKQRNFLDGHAWGSILLETVTR